MGDDTTRFCSEPPLVKFSGLLSGPKIREQVDSSKEDKSGDVNPSTDLESVVSSEEGLDDFMSPGMWRYPTSLDHSCIYRVPNRLRDINPKAYTPQLLLIGPLNLSLKKAWMYDFGNNGNITNARGYVNMEHHKKIYLKAFRQRVKDENVINEFKRVIKEDEEMIRGSYSESTTWIQSQDFMKMILRDSVFILEFILRSFENVGKKGKKRGDVLMDEPMAKNTVHEDLILLENQLPYSILQKLFDPIVPKLPPHKTFRNLIIEFFKFEGKIKDDTEFKHFTDLFRCVRVETLNLKEEVDATREDEQAIESMYNVEKLDDAGVKFEAIDKTGLSLEVKFEKGCLKLPCFWVHDSVEMILRNIMALEQCHYPFEAYVCSFVIFLDHLIDTHKDVDLLVGKGIIKNWMGDHGYVAEMVNKLSLGLVDFGSIYYNITTQANDYCNNPINKARAILKRVYFSNPWTGTATVAAVLLLLMTLIQTVASVLQLLQK